MYNILERYENNPIIDCNRIPGTTQVYNAAAVKFQGQYLLLITALGRDVSPELFLARSSDGVNFDIDNEPLITYQHEHEDWICDPRITYLEGKYYIIYWSGSKHGIRGVMASTEDFKTFKNHGYTSLPDNRNIVLFPEKINGFYARLDRPAGVIQKGSIWVSYSPDLIHWGKSAPVLSAGPMFQWEGEKIGPGVPPIKTSQGWLIIYHAVHGGFPGYYLGCALLDLQDPSKVIGKSKVPILAPKEDYERNGAVPNVVFSCGAILEENGEDLKIYYAGADTVICLANSKISKLVKSCL